MDCNKILEDKAIIQCKSLVLNYGTDNAALAGPSSCEFAYKTMNSINLTISINQGGNRKVELSCYDDVSVDTLVSVAASVEKLIMMFDGSFIPLKELTFAKSGRFNDEELAEASLCFMRRRLKYFYSSDISNYTNNKFVNFNEVIDDQLFKNWVEMEKDLDIALHVMFYCLSEFFTTVDLRSAFIIEIAQPMVELVIKHTNLFTSLEPGQKKATLKTCLDSLISKYGTYIFDKEINSKKNYLKVLVNSRNRIMHVKQNQNKEFLNGEESVIYIQKLFFLYRIIIFSLLGIEEEDYEPSVRARVDSLNSWSEILDNFIIRIN